MAVVIKAICKDCGGLGQAWLAHGLDDCPGCKGTGRVDLRLRTSGDVLDDHFALRGMGPLANANPHPDSAAAGDEHAWEPNPNTDPDPPCYCNGCRGYAATAPDAWHDLDHARNPSGWSAKGNPDRLRDQDDRHDETALSVPIRGGLCGEDRAPMNQGLDTWRQR